MYTDRAKFGILAHINGQIRLGVADRGKKRSSMNYMSAHSHPKARLARQKINCPTSLDSASRLWNSCLSQISSVLAIGVTMVFCHLLLIARTAARMI